MGLFGIKKEKEVDDFNNNVFFNTPQNDIKAFTPGSNVSFNGGNETVLAPQPVIDNTPEVLETNIKSQNETYKANDVAPLSVSAPVGQTIKPSVDVSNPSVAPVSIPSVNTQTESVQATTSVSEPTVAVQTTVSAPEVSVNNQVQPKTTEELERDKQQMDALNNANNPIPVNPVAPAEETFNYASVEVSIKDVINLCINSLIKPGTTMVEEGNKYRDNFVAAKVTLFITLIAVVVNIVSSIVSGCFSTGYSLVNGASYTSFDPNNLMNVNWLGVIVSGVMMSGISIAIISGVYYASSFIKSKGIAFGRYLMVANIAFIPFIAGITILFPLGSIISGFIGLSLLGVSLIYSIVSFISGINNLLSIDSVNKNIIYNVINLGLIYVVLMFIVFKVFYANIIDAISMLH